MIHSLRISFVILFFLGSLHSSAPVQAQMDDSTAAVEDVAETTGDDSWKVDFPLAGYRQPFAFPLLKFFLILIAFFVWLRALRLCLDDGQQNQELQVESWSKKLFAIGLVGILIAILLPSYLLGAGLLLATCVAPSWQYARWRNEQVGDQTLPLRWPDFLGIPSTVVPTVTDVELALVSGLATNPTSETITFVGKSFGERITSGLAAGSGFETALALLGNAVSKSATDLHVGAKDDKVAVRLRIDGEIVAQDPIPIKMGLSVINVFKVLCDLDITDKRRSQDGSFRADVGDRRLYFRVSSQGTNTGEKLSIRILDPAERFSAFPDLGINSLYQERLTEIFSRKSGLILFVGTAGSGKSTSAYASLRHLDAGDRNIVTLEDPIEYSISSIDQIEVKTRLGQTFEAGFRSVLRQDADIMLIGEIRDEETAKIACQAAMTGQLVLSTLHGTDTVSAVLRLADLGVDYYNIAAALRAVVGQLLVRKLCEECRIVYEPNEQMSQTLGLTDSQGKLYQRPDPLSNPCLNCNSRGLLGRTGLFELLEITPPIRELIRERASVTLINSSAAEQGMTKLWDDGLRLVREGVISPQELLLAVETP